MAVAKPFLSERFMSVTVPTLRARGMETRLGIDGQMVTFERSGEPLLSAEVVVEWANRAPEGSTGAIRVTGTEGNLLGRVDELTVKAGDLFMVAGYPAEITVAAKEVEGVMVAGFRMVQGRGGA